jgi:hypothetical protein
LLPQDDTPALPPLKNRPPRIIEDQAVVNGSPARQLTIQVGEGCPSLEFSAPVEDPDIDDQLIARLFVDYEVVSAAEQHKAKPPIREIILMNQGTPLRTARFEDVNPNAQGNPLGEETTHIVDLLVTDGRIGFPGMQPPKEPVEGYEQLDPRYSVTYTWVIHTEKANCTSTPLP